MPQQPTADSQQPITLLGLGPGDSALLTRQAWRVLEESVELYLRTRQHPVVAELPAHLEIFSFDHLYETGESFESLYEQIVSQVLALGRRPQGVVYAVPGHPFVAEATAPEIARRARLEGLPVRVVEGLSFLEPTFTALGLDPFPHIALVDALELAEAHVPPFPASAPVIIAQIHSQMVASEVKLALMAHYPDEHPVKLVHAAGTSQERVEELALYEIDRSPEIGLLTALYAPPLGPATSFEAFQEIVAHLRAPDGCPWDREQTHQSLRSDLLEEAYEALQALDADDPHSMCEEFGDLLLVILMHVQIASEYGEFTMADVLQRVNAKIVRRHPHVFGDLKVVDSQGVLLNWERIKQQERSLNGKVEASLLGSVALALPALLQARQYQERVARVGFDWPDVQGAVDKLEEELHEVYAAIGRPVGQDSHPDITAANGVQARYEEIGDLLFAVVNLARRYEIDAESALREANVRFRRRFAYLENFARSQGKTVAELPPDEMQALWQEAKKAG